MEPETAFYMVWAISSSTCRHLPTYIYLPTCLPHGMGHLLVQIGADDVAELLVRDTARVVLVEGAEELAHLVRARVRIKARVSIQG